MKESDLYPALKSFLETQQYEVKGEVRGCDVMAMRGDEQALIVELKLSLNLTVLLQAVNRLALSPLVILACRAIVRYLRNSANISSNYCGCWVLV